MPPLPRAAASRAAWYALAVLVGVALLRWTDQVIVIVGTEPMRRELALTDLQLGLLQGLGVTLAAALGGIPLAWLADRYGNSRVLAACVVFWSAATAMRGFARDFQQVMASTAGMAIAEAALMPVVYAILPRHFQGRQLATANLVFYACSSLGYSAAMVLCGLLFRFLDTHAQELPGLLRGMESWRSASFAVGVVGPVFALAVLFIADAPRRRLGRAAASIPSALPADAAPWPFVRRHARTLLGLYGAATLTGLALGPLLAWIAPAMARKFGLQPAEVGTQVGTLLLSATVTGIALSALFQRLWGARWGVLLPLRIGPWLTALSAPAIAATALLPSHAGVRVGLFVALVALIAFNANMPSVYQLTLPASYRARMSAVTLSLVAVGGALGPVLVGALSDAMGASADALLQACAWIGVPCALLAALAMHWGSTAAAATIDEVRRLDSRDA
ncbi:MAG: MFS transporter [Burkholderiales bacterium]|nr:MFS transporter [Burkholderiales bacterium]